MRVSYNGYYVAFPRLRRGFDSRHPHHFDYFLFEQVLMTRGLHPERGHRSAPVITAYRSLVEDDEVGFRVDQLCQFVADVVGEERVASHAVTRPLRMLLVNRLQLTEDRLDRLDMEDPRSAVGLLRGRLREVCSTAGQAIGAAAIAGAVVVGKRDGGNYVALTADSQALRNERKAVLSLLGEPNVPHIRVLMPLCNTERLDPDLKSDLQSRLHRVGAAAMPEVALEPVEFELRKL
jgi:hypothetical protein